MGHPPPDTAPPPEAPKCPVCGEPFVRRDLVLCQQCSAPHHRKCWSYNKGCATYACPSRTFLLPPVGPDEEIEFSAAGTPNLMWMMLLIPGFLFTVLACSLALPEAVLEPVVLAVTSLFVPAILATTVGPLLTTRRTLLDPATGNLRRQLLFGGRTVQDDPRWRRFSDVEELEVESAQRHPQKGETPVHVLEVYLRDVQGERHLLEATLWSEREAALERAQAAADVLDTTLGLPREVQSAKSLPAGLSQALAALPRSAGGDDEEEPSRLEG